jgi:hypothetical protein
MSSQARTPPLRTGAGDLLSHVRMPHSSRCFAKGADFRSYTPLGGRAHSPVHVLVPSPAISRCGYPMNVFILR